MYAIKKIKKKMKAIMFSCYLLRQPVWFFLSTCSFLSLKFYNSVKFNRHVTTENVFLRRDEFADRKLGKISVHLRLFRPCVV